MNTISGAEIRAKAKAGMTSEQIAKELVSSPTDEVKPSQVAQLQMENEKLKEENEKLKEEAVAVAMGYNLKVLSLAQLKKLKKEDLVNRCIALDAVIQEDGKRATWQAREAQRQLNAIEKLKQENEKLNDECDQRVGGDDHDAVVMENEKLKEENEKLKQENEWEVGKDEGDVMLTRMVYYVRQINEHREKLFEESEKLKEQAKKIEEAVREVGHVDTISKCNDVWYE